MVITDYPIIQVGPSSRDNLCIKVSRRPALECNPLESKTRDV